MFLLKQRTYSRTKPTKKRKRKTRKFVSYLTQIFAETTFKHMVFPEDFTRNSLVHNCLAFHYGYAFARYYYESDHQYGTTILTPPDLYFFYAAINWNKFKNRTSWPGTGSQTTKPKYYKIKQICFIFSSNTNKTCSVMKAARTYSNSLCD